MPISTSHYLFALIKSLTKAEKRNFKLYARRVHSEGNMKFIQLFEVIDKLPEMDEAKVLKKLSGIDKTQFSNLKRHLYTQILTSLRLIHINRISSIGIREQIDFAHVLYSRGLYQQSLKILQRAKNMADNMNLDILVLEILEFQKIIESRHITHTGPIKNDELTVEAQNRVEKVYSSVRLSNLRVRLHGNYIKNSHVKDESEKREVVRFFEDNLGSVDESTLSALDMVYLCQCYVWYYYILLDFKNCFEYARRWVDVFDHNPDLLRNDPDLYMRGYHYLMMAAHNLNDLESLRIHLQRLEAFRETNYGKFSENSKIFSFLYVHWARFNVHFLEGTFDEGMLLVPRTLKRIKRYKGRIASHRIMVMYYKIAWMHLGHGQAGKAIQFINQIINNGDKTDFRADIQAYSRLLFLMAHYDEDNVDILPYLVSTIDSFFKKTIVRNKLQDATLRFFRKVATVSISERQTLLNNFRSELLVIREDPFEKRAFTYLDIISWVNARIAKKTISQVIKANLSEKK